MSSIRRTTVHSIPPVLTVVIVLLLLMTPRGPAMAARNAGGAMVLHVDNSITFSGNWDYCTSNPLPATCQELVTNVTKDPSAAALVWMVAAFPTNSTPGVTAFQVGINGDIPADYYTSWAPCEPGAIEIPDATWPAPGTGTACGFGHPVYERLFKLYWFAVTAPGVGSTLRTMHYPHNDSLAEWADDGDPPQIDVCEKFGSVVWGSVGQNECPGLIQPGACCYPDGRCQVLLQTACTGQYMGDGAVCDPNPCAQPAGACCFPDGHCTELVMAECQQQGGGYEGDGTTCDPNPCPQPTGACCFADGRCVFGPQAECEQLCGTYQGDNTTCVPNPCPSRGFVLFKRSAAPLGSNPFAREAGAALLLGGRNAGGAMLLHVDNSICYSSGSDYCSIDPLPPTCEELVTNVTNDPSVTALVWMVAAFPENSTPGVTAFQVGVTGDIPADYYSAYAPCGLVEVPDATWPAPGTGTACGLGGAVYERLFKIYWFAVAAPRTDSELGTMDYPNGDHHAEWADDSYPPRIDICDKFGRIVWGGEGQNQCPSPIEGGACCFSDGRCQILQQSVCTGQYMGDNTVCDPNPCTPPTGACCFVDGHCAVLMLVGCQQQGGNYEGDGTTCNPNPCPQPTGACCLTTVVCEQLTAAGCAATGGIYQGDFTTCNPNPCGLPMGACCFPDGHCTVRTDAQCAADGGTGWTMGGTCNPNPCRQPSNANGAMVVHTNDEIAFSAGWEYCTEYPLPATCAEFNTRTDKPVDTVESVMWVVGAWPSNVSPAVTAFQFGVYHNLPMGSFSSWAPCGPGIVEIPDATWPNESGTGTAVGFGAPVYPPNSLLKLYWFAAVGVSGGFVSSGAYPHGSMTAQFADDAYPPQATDVYQFGTVRWGAPGENQCPCLAGNSAVLPTEWDVQWRDDDNGSVRWYLAGGQVFDVHEVDGNSLRLNGSVPPSEPPVIVPFMEGFEGPVLIARFQRGQAVHSLDDQSLGPKSVFMEGSVGTQCLRSFGVITLIDSADYGTSGEGDVESLSRFAVGAARPNPTNDATSFHLSIPATGSVDAEIYGADGRRIRSLVHHTLSPGHHDLEWDGRTDDGRRVSTGIYFVRVRYEGQMREQRFTVLH